MQKYFILIIYILGVFPEHHNLAYRNMSALLIIRKKMHVDAWITKNRFNPQLPYFQPLHKLHHQLFTVHEI
jgi:hypothetical protein